MILIIIVTICLFITLWVILGISYTDSTSIKEIIFGNNPSTSDYIEFKDKTTSRLRMLEQEREIDYAMLKETREDVKKLKSQLYIAEGEK